MHAVHSLITSVFEISAMPSRKGKRCLVSVAGTGCIQLRCSQMHNGELSWQHSGMNWHERDHVALGH